MQIEELRVVPRFPLPKEKMKFLFDEGDRIFAVRDISVRGLGIGLIEFGESTLFPVGMSARAELRLDGAPIVVEVTVVRVSAWTVGLVFSGLSPENQQKINDFVDPLRIGSTLKLVDKRGVPDAFLQGMSAWYHGDSATDFYFWNDSRGGLKRALLCVGRRFWEWDVDSGPSTGDVQRQEGDRVVLHRHSTPDAKVRATIRKVLEHAEVLDYRLVSFLREKT